MRECLTLDAQELLRSGPELTDRDLAVLRYISDSEGHATKRAVQAYVGFRAAAVVKSLRTLRGAGYIRVGDSGEGYECTDTGAIRLCMSFTIVRDGKRWAVFGSSDTPIAEREEIARSYLGIDDDRGEVVLESMRLLPKDRRKVAGRINMLHARTATKQCPACGRFGSVAHIDKAGMCRNCLPKEDKRAEGF